MNPRVLLTIEGDVSLERAIHRRLDAARVRHDGEWFHATTDLLAFIEGLRLGTEITAGRRTTNPA